VSPLQPDIFLLSSSTLTSAIHSSLQRCAGRYSSGLHHSREPLHPSLAPFNLHKCLVRRASPSDGFFERDASHLLVALRTHPGVASEKALASSGPIPTALIHLVNWNWERNYFFTRACQFVTTVSGGELPWGASAT
jgi:hypothetical protein